MSKKKACVLALFGLLPLVGWFVYSTFIAMPKEYTWSIPTGFPKPLVHEGNPMSEAKVSLGRYLFYDQALSGNGTQSCASCHQQAYAFAENRKVSVGSTGQAHTRNALALVNVAYNKTLTWSHPFLTDIEAQLLIPMFGQRPIEMGITGNEASILKHFRQGDYPSKFKAAFGSEEVSFNRIVQALAAFVRSLISLSSPFDRYAYSGDDNALTEQQIKGMNLFFSERLECHHCHGGFNFTQSTTHENQPINRFAFHNTGLYYTDQPNFNHKGYPQYDRGMIDVTLNLGDEGRFRAPTLRNVELTAPYMHDGSIATLSDVIDFYAAGGRNIESGPLAGDGRLHPNKSLFVKGFVLSNDEKQALLAFLHSLTDNDFVTNEKYSDPRTSKNKN
ncbi:di-heme enzyme (plasmid) [Pseudoalteromonas xiamenensis]|uniref:MbnH family di-heme enzyme n=1 Tax=Pseudoalteromonas xiamenensis TaxID=882626 RepID=UPI0027E43E6D|nr:MbnH family di-heme enzyme [Pseudoalteromonas xiamenensis]WMN61830.1 di-heme enzyme [Pseudoalteromonas xiamenensis]